MWWQKTIEKFRQLSWTERWLLVEAALWLTVVRLILHLVPFRRLAPHLGDVNQESPMAVAPQVSQTAVQVGWAVRAVARRTPWESACLAQASSAKFMLRRRHVQSTLYLGLARDDSQALQAHAWLRCGSEILTGKRGHQRYSVISTFAEAEELPNLVPETGEIPAAVDVEPLFLSLLRPSPEPEVKLELSQLDEPAWQKLVDLAYSQRVQ